MFAYAAWFAEQPVSPTTSREWQARARRHLAACTPATWHEQEYAGVGWGALVRHADLAGWRWAFADHGDGRSVLSAGLPVGVDAASPLQLGGRLLRGDDVHDGVVPPFGLIAVDETEGHLAVQQDWYGMGQVFRYRSDRSRGVVGFANRPSVLPEVFGDPVRPDDTGWSYYLGNSAFAASTSPVAGVRLLHPGERVTGTRDPRGGWRLTHERRRAIDDLVGEAVAARPGFDETAEQVADGVRRVTRSLTRYWGGPVTLGLSGGKDSRLIAAALVSAGTVPRFSTNEENPVEGETARRLATILRERRGLDVDHHFYVATQREKVFAMGLAERARLLQRRNDHMFASTYLNRPAEGPQPDEVGAPSLTGALGECLTDIWLPKDWLADAAVATAEGAREVLVTKLTRTVPPEMLRRPAIERLEALVDGLCADAAGHGLDPFQVVLYGYLLGRMRRACTALTHIEQVMPLAIPEAFVAGFRMTPAEKAERLVHNAVIARLVPEWRDVPFVSFRTGMTNDQILRIWHRSGADELGALLRRPEGPVTALVDRGEVRDALARAVAGKGGNREDAELRQFAMASVADEAFEVAEQAGASRRARSLADRHPMVGRAVAPLGRARRVVRRARRVARDPDALRAAVRRRIPWQV